MLTADIAIANFSANGTNLLIDYDITGASVSAFDISIYRSADGTNLDAVLQTQRMTNSADLQVGAGHRLTLSPSFTDTWSDYFLVAVVDSSGEIAESSETNNKQALASGAFQTADGLVHVHGVNIGETIVVSEEATTFKINLQSTEYLYSLSAVTGVRIRSHGGSDIVIAAYTSKPQFISGGADVDLLIGGSGSDYILGGDGNDTIYGGDGGDTIYGEAGNDFIEGDAGSDSIYGGAGNDYLFGGDGNDYLYGNDGDDVLHGEAGNDVVYGDAGNDTLYVGSGGDALVGGTGSDTYVFEADVGDANSDTIIESANADTDTLDFSSFTGAYTANMMLNLTQTSSQVVIPGKARIALLVESAFENVICGAGNDTVIGNSRANVIHGGNGNDTIYGGAGNDSLFGGAGADYLYGQNGNDLLSGDAGDDILNGGAGDDTYRFWASGDLGTDTIAETAGNGTDTLDFSQGLINGIGLDLRDTSAQGQPVDTYLWLKLSNANAIENVIGTDGFDVIHGNSLNNVIHGLAGDDWIEGHEGDDVLYGGAGSDAIFGQEGNDTIYGGQGDDFLYGDDGICSCATNDADTIYGEEGNDYLEGGGDADYLDGGPGIDDFGPIQPEDEVADRPVISNFGGSYSGGLLTVSGHVDDDDDVEGLTVFFGGVLEGYTAIVDEDGNFEITIEYTPQPGDEVTAITTDWEGLESNEPIDILF